MTYFRKSQLSAAVEAATGSDYVIMTGDTIPVRCRFSFSHNGVVYFDGVAIIDEIDHRKSELLARVFIPEKTEIPHETGRSFPVMTKSQFLAQRAHIMGKTARIPVVAD